MKNNIKLSDYLGCEENMISISFNINDFKDFINKINYMVN